MTPAARAQAAIELLDEIIEAARGAGASADVLIARYFKSRRYAGSKDRRAVRELVYRAIRRAGALPESGRAALIGVARDDADVAAAFTGDPRGAAPMDDAEPAAPAGTAPAWLEARLAASLPPEEWPALLGRAPLDIRINRLKALAGDVAIPGAQPIAGLPQALRLPEGTQVERLPDHAAGRIEVQDAGSQIVAAMACARPGMTVIDLCAGAGGKTLAMAADMAAQGVLIACDADRGRLSRLLPRAMRAGVGVVETRLLDPGKERAALGDLAGTADVVLVDAPCSGTGTWRRNPEARWRLTPARLAALVTTQARLIDIAAGLVRPGGHLVYITCSLLDEEGRGQIDRFLAAHPDWAVTETTPVAGRRHGGGWRLTPASDGTDGFFVARLERPC